jgi:hypothetical protein
MVLFTTKIKFLPTYRNQTIELVVTSLDMTRMIMPVANQ